MTGGGLELSDALVAFAVQWEPFGGASPADVFVEFGIDIDEYRRRLFSRLCRPDRALVPLDVHGRLIRSALEPAESEPRVGE